MARIIVMAKNEVGVMADISRGLGRQWHQHRDHQR